MAKRIPVRWPKGAVPWLAAIGMAVGLTIAYVPAARTVVPLGALYQFALTAFRSEPAFKMVMNLGVLAHVLEAVYTFHLANKEQLDTQSTM
mmetsp:Transcript_3982/g.8579  ORF Transcript_3982/g.8579 Transcript_3982/m.8579 type:complete len:91 (-) Transcript_3982:176-448(-)